ncbi:MAG: Asp-tRNA(Asn)/Glu-tRNA(Gln) amidotransferase subunit GatC [Candidatus Zambryskibacteria bacterium]
MISKEEIKKLADLARIDIEEKEMENLAGEMDAILDYVGQVSEVAEISRVSSPSKGEGDTIVRGEVNVMREDENPTESETHSKELITEFPNSENNYLKVKKIM